MNVPRPIDTSKLTLPQAENLLREAKRLARECKIKLDHIENHTYTKLSTHGSVIIQGLLNMNRERIAILETYIKQQKESLKCQRNQITR